MRRLVIFLAGLLLATSAFAQGSTPRLRYAGQETLTLSSGAASTLQSIPASQGGVVVKTYCRVDGQAVRWWAGATPSATVGVQIDVGAAFNFASIDMTTVTFIRTAAVSAVISCQYFY